MEGREDEGRKKKGEKRDRRRHWEEARKRRSSGGAGACLLLHQRVHRGQYDENKLHNEAWRQQKKCVQEATLSPLL